MKWLRRLGRRLRGIGPVRPEDSMDDEMRFHLEMEARDLQARGHDPREARRLARVRFGGVERYKEEGRDARGRLVDDLIQDVRYAWRGIVRRPGFAAAVVATLAIGIGATTAVWSVVDVALLRPLGYPAGEELMRIRTSWEGEPEGAVSPAEYLDYRRAADGVFDAIGAYASGSATVRQDDAGSAAELVDVAFISASLFPVLAVPPLAGRGFTESEELTGDNVVVVSEAFWRSRMGADPGAVGSALSLSGWPYTVVGVVPSSFRLPESLVQGTEPSLYLPLGIHPDTTYQRGSHFLQVAARLTDGVPPERGARTIEEAVARFVPRFPDDYEPDMNFRATAVPLREAVVRHARPALLAALGSVVLVLLVGAANVAALLLARGEARRGEIALRSTLGARRPRILRQLAVESLMLGLAGGALGVGLAWLAVEALLALNPAGIPMLDRVGIDGRVLAFAGVLSLGCGLLFGGIPAFRVAPDGAAGALREAGSRSASRAARRLRGALVVGEIAFALTLITGAGLMTRSMAELLAVDTGLRIDNVMSADFTVAGPSYESPESVPEFVARTMERVRAVPGVEAAGVVTNLPLAEGIGDLGVEIPGRVLPSDGNLAVDWQAASPDYDRAVGLRLISGRWIDDTDRADAIGAVVINRTFAETWWPAGDAVGSTLRLTADAAPREARIVGVVEDVKHEGPSSAAGLQMYLPHRQFRFWHGGGPARALALVIRTRAGGGTHAGAVRDAFAEVDPSIGLSSFITLEQAYRDVLSPPRLITALLAAFAAIALVLSAIGVYGVTAYSVGLRRREFGIRIALGARDRRIARQVLGEGLRLAVMGVGLGLLGALVLSRAVRSLLFNVSPLDPWILALGATTLLAATLAACWLPARRALAADPLEALRAE